MLKQLCDAMLSDMNVVLCYVLSQYRCVYRLPVMSPALNPQEAAMMEMLRQVELEDSMLSDHEVRHKSVFNVIFRPFSSCLLQGYGYAFISSGSSILG
jgi:hypothetical protein